jgi:hypothetical protein
VQKRKEANAPSFVTIFFAVQEKFPRSKQTLRRRSRYNRRVNLNNIFIRSIYYHLIVYDILYLSILQPARCKRSRLPASSFSLFIAFFGRVLKSTEKKRLRTSTSF